MERLLSPGPDPDIVDVSTRPAVLIVDDEAPIINFAQRALSTAGYDAYPAASGLDALAVLQSRNRFDLFIIDLAMPDMLGTELAQQIRRTQREAKILYFTGYANRLLDQKNPLPEGEALIEKPATATALREAASQLLFGHTRGPGSLGQ